MAASDLYFNPSVPPATRITAVENDGAWEPGGTYSISARHYTVIYSQGSHDPEPGLPDWIEQWGYEILGFHNTIQTNASKRLLFTEAGEPSYVLKNVPYTQSVNSDPYISSSGLVATVTWALDSSSTVYNNSSPDVISGDTDYAVDVTYSVTLPADIVEGTYYILYGGYYRFAISGSDWTITTEYLRIKQSIEVVAAGASAPAIWIKGRPVDYDPDAVWDPNAPGGSGNGNWTTPSALTTAGGGQYHRQLVVVGDRQIYYGDL